MNELKKICDYLHPLQDRVGEGILLFDLSGKVVLANRLARRLLHHSAVDLKGKKADTILPLTEFDFQDVLRTLIRDYSKMISISHESEDGNTLLIPCLATLIYETYQSPIGVLVVMRNPALLKSEEIPLLKRQRNILRALNFRGNEMCSVTDIQLRSFIYCSDSVKNILGWTAEEYRTGGLALALCIGDREKNAALLLQYLNEIKLRNEEKYKHDHLPMVFEYRLRHKNGAWKWFKNETLVLQRDEDGMIRYTIGFVKDITADKLKNTKLNEQLLEELLEGALDDILISPSPKTLNPDNFSELSVREKEILSRPKKSLQFECFNPTISLQLLHSPETGLQV